MTKRDMLFEWAKEKDWFYLSEVPYASFGMSQAAASTSLIDFCKQNRMDFRVVGKKQYRVRGKTNAA